jgi:DNA-binding transcriptional LysR family regulator
MNPTNRIFADLNLLRVFLTIWDVRNLTVAGQRLSLTQPAVSHALRRLREAFDDPLFVRVTSGMVPTEAATRLHPPLSEAFQIIQRAVQDIERFNPATAQRVFRVAMSDVSELYFLPSLMTRLARDAPLVHLRIVPLDPTTVAQAMRAGEVDITIGFVPGLERDIISHSLFTDSFVCLVRAGHPITRIPMTGEHLGQELTALGYVYASTSATGHQLTEQWLTDIGVKRQIVLRLGHFTIAPSVVLGSDLATIFPESVARLINARNEFAILPLPPGRPLIDIMVHTHMHFRGDLGIQWLRDSIVAQFSDDRRPGAA